MEPPDSYGEQEARNRAQMLGLLPPEPCERAEIAQGEYFIVDRRIELYRQVADTLGRELVGMQEENARLQEMNRRLRARVGRLENLLHYIRDAEDLVRYPRHIIDEMFEYALDDS